MKQFMSLLLIHSVEPKSEQLKMYLGGMGGTGKSQVIKALSIFLEKRNEAHHFVIPGPTGTSAALLNGSTYHSFLGLGFGNNKKKLKLLILLKLK